MVKRVVLIHPSARRYSGYLSTHRFPGLVTSHAGLSILAGVLDQIGVCSKIYDEKITPFRDELVDGADLVGSRCRPRGHRRRIASPTASGAWARRWCWAASTRR